LIGRRIAACAFILAIACGEVRQAAADVVVLANRAGEAVRYRLAPAEPPREAQSDSSAKDAWATVEPGDIATIPVAGQATLEFLAGKSAEQYDVEADRCYFFYEDKAGDLRLEAIGLAVEEAERPAGAAQPAQQRVETTPAAKPLAIPVKLLVDDDERAARGRWEARLRARLETASALFERTCRVKFVVAEVAAWDSDDATTDFEQSLAEFEREVQPRPQRLAIGFTSQYPLVQGRVHLGGTRGPLHSHVLLREWSQQISESERLEVLVHELGHFLGAVHSPEPNSVMRPNLGDRKARLREFRIAFDPLNALAMCLVGETLERRPTATFAALPPPTRSRLTAVYRTLAEAMPDDPAPPQYLSLLGVRVSPPPISLDRPPLHLPQAPSRPIASKPRGNLPISNRPPTAQPPSLPVAPSPNVAADKGLVESTRAVLQAIVAAARGNRARPVGRQAAREELFRREGDDLTEACVRAAAAAADEAPQIYRQQAFCLGLAIGLDTSEQLRSLPLVGELVRAIEPENARQQRLSTLDPPTMRKRHDLAQHFWVSAAIASIAGPAAAEAAGVAKELRDADGGSGFSFADLCADLAGIALAERLKSGQTNYSALRRQFEVAGYLPPVGDLVEGLAKQKFSERYGSTSDSRFVAARQQILDRIAELHRDER
jgi:hypothetical protein